MVSWSSPEVTNGMIINYELCYGQKVEQSNVHEFAITYILCVLQDAVASMSCQNISSHGQKYVTEIISYLTVGVTYQIKVRKNE